MTKDEALTELKAAQADGRPANLTGADLRYADLAGANLTGASLTGASLTGANLTGANLTGANLADAHLRGADLRGANLADADLTYANLTNAHLTYAHLTGANLTNAYLRYANLADAYLRYANLADADLTYANLTNADLSQSKGLLSSADWLRENTQTTKRGCILAYKAIGNTDYTAPASWTVESGAYLTEVVNPDRGSTCACGVNIGTLDYVTRHYPDATIWQVGIEPADIADVVVPFETDGKFRAARVRLIKIVKESR